MDPIDRLGFQLYSAREFPPLEQTLARLKELGYALVEPYDGLFGDIEALQHGIERHGLAAPTAHIGLARLRNDFDGVVRVAERLGLEVVIIPNIRPEDRPSDGLGYSRVAEEIDLFRQRLGGVGLKLGWHNHNWEFQRLDDGRTPLEIFLDTSVDLLWEADIAWIVRAGENPVAWMERYGHRMIAAHIKDTAMPPAGAEDGWEDVGHGVLDWKSIVPALRGTSAQYWIMEHDKPSDVDRFARRSIDAVRAWRGAGL